MRHESRRRVTMGADVEMKDGDKKMETKEEEKKAEPVKTLDVLDVVRCVPDLPSFQPCPRTDRTDASPSPTTDHRPIPPPFDSQLFENVTLLEKSAASKGEPRFVAKVLRQVRRARPSPVAQTASSVRSRSRPSLFPAQTSTPPHPSTRSDARSSSLFTRVRRPWRGARSSPRTSWWTSSSRRWMTPTRLNSR